MAITVLKTVSIAGFSILFIAYLLFLHAALRYRFNKKAGGYYTMSWMRVARRLDRGDGTLIVRAHYSPSKVFAWVPIACSGDIEARRALTLYDEDECPKPGVFLTFPPFLMYIFHRSLYYRFRFAKVIVIH